MNRRTFLIRGSLATGGIAGLSYFGLLRREYAAELSRYGAVDRFSTEAQGPSIRLKFADGEIVVQTRAPVGNEFVRTSPEFEAMSKDLCSLERDRYHEGIADELTRKHSTDVLGFPVSESEMVILSELRRMQ